MMSSTAISMFLKVLLKQLKKNKSDRDSTSWVIQSWVITNETSVNKCISFVCYWTWLVHDTPSYIYLVREAYVSKVVSIWLFIFPFQLCSFYDSQAENLSLWPSY